MGIDKSQLLEDAKRCLNPEQVERSIIYLNLRFLRSGEQVKAGPQTLTMPFEGNLIFVDLSPKTNWAHPCLYILVDNKTHRIKAVESSFPPVMDQPGEDYIVILRFGQKPLNEYNLNSYDNEKPTDNRKVVKGGE